jgi:integrase
MEQRPEKLLDHVREAIRLKHDSRHTEDASVTWITRDIFFHDTRHPKAMGAAEIEAFLTHLAVQQTVAASTQNQALSALLFLDRDVLRQPLDGPIDAIRARKPRRLPTVLTTEEVLQVIGTLSGTSALMAKLLYGTGMRLMECLRLRVKDLDFGQLQIVVRDGKGLNDRVTMLPASLIVPLQEHLARVQRLHAHDVAQRVAPVSMPFALERKYPQAGSGSGNSSFPPTGCRKTRGQGSSAAITPMRVGCNGPSVGPAGWLGSPNASVVIPYGIALRRICSSRAMISGQCRNSWGIRT